MYQIKTEEKSPEDVALELYFKTQSTDTTIDKYKIVRETIDNFLKIKGQDLACQVYCEWRRLDAFYNEDDLLSFDPVREFQTYCNNSGFPNNIIPNINMEVCSTSTISLGPIKSKDKQPKIDDSQLTQSSFDCFFAKSEDEQLEMFRDGSKENLQQQPVSSLASQGSQKPMQKPLVVPVRCATAGKKLLHKPNARRIESFLSSGRPENFSKTMQQMNDKNKEMERIRTERALMRQGQHVLTQFFSPVHS